MTRTAPAFWTLALITLSGTLGSHMFIPAMPAAAAAFGTSQAAIQLTISLYVLGLAMGQIMYGPLADWFGRRPVLLGGLTLYVLAGIAAAAAPDLPFLIAARLLQALGACAGLVLGRAMVRDLAGPQAAAGKLALLNGIISGGPALAPVIGSLVSLWFDWRVVAFLPSGFGLAMLILAWLRVPETGQRAPDTTLRGLARDYGRLLRSPVFLWSSLGGGCSSTALYGFLASAPFLFAQMGHSAAESGYWSSTVAISVAISSFATPRLLRVVAPGPLLLGAGLFGLSGALLLVGAPLLGFLNLATVMTGVTIFALGAGVTAPLAFTLSINVNPRLIGSAAGLHGCSQQGFGALWAALSGLGTNAALTAGLTVSAAALLGCTAFVLALRAERRG